MQYYLKKNIGYIIYGLWWVLTTIVELCFLHFNANIDITFAVADSIVFNLVFAIISIGLWFWVRYSDFEKQSIETIIFNHFASLVLSILIWLSASTIILQNIFPNDENYLQFLKDSKIIRIIIGMLYYFIISIAYYLNIYIQNFREQLARETELRTLIRDAELTWLKLQINPHFLFNSLNSISSLTMSNPDKAQNMIIRLSELLRYSLKQSPQSFVPLKDEIDNCTKYLEIEKVRFGERLNYSIHCDEDIEAISVPAMILQPLFENAIKHGVASSPEFGNIDASFSNIGGYLSVEISNSISNEFPSVKGTGVGVANIARRLSLLYGQNDLIKTRVDGNLYIVNLKIPSVNLQTQ